MESIAKKLHDSEPEVLKCFGADYKYKYFKYFFRPNNPNWRYPAFTKKVDRAKVFTDPEEKYDVIKHFQNQNELNYMFVSSDKL